MSSSLFFLILVTTIIASIVGYYLAAQQNQQFRKKQAMAYKRHIRELNNTLFACMEMAMYRAHNKKEEIDHIKLSTELMDFIVNDPYHSEFLTKIEEGFIYSGAQDLEVKFELDELSTVYPYFIHYKEC